MNATAAASLIVATFALRAVYLRWWCGYELVGDEALYWESSRRPDWGYYEKGPLMPWSIALSTTWLGTAEWTVRLSAAAWSALAAFGVLRLALRASGGNGAMAFIATTLFLLAPAFQANAQLATPDAALIAFWVWGCDAGLALVWSWRSPRGASAGAGLWFGLVLGLGTLAKQSMLLLGLGVLVAGALNWWTDASGAGSRGRGENPNAGETERGQAPRRFAGRSPLWVGACALIAFGIAVAPLGIWNAQHGWPTVMHTLEHLGVYESAAPPADAPSNKPLYDPAWTLSLVAAQIGAFGPAICILMWLGIRTVRSDEMRTLTHFALAALAVYLLVSLTKRPEPNWPFHAFASLLVPAAAVVVRELPLLRQRVRDWLADPHRPRPHAGFLRRRPESLAQVAWDWAIIYGVVGQLLLAFLPQILARAPDSGLTQRFRGHAARAAAVELLAREIESQTGRRPPILAAHYMDAGLLAFYLPGRPTVWNGGRLLGTRASSYDYWADTQLKRATESAGPLLLVGSNKLEKWLAGLPGWEVQSAIPERKIFIARRRSAAQSADTQ